LSDDKQQPSEEQDNPRYLLSAQCAHYQRDISWLKGFPLGILGVLGVLGALGLLGCLGYLGLEKNPKKFAQSKIKRYLCAN